MKVYCQKCGSGLEYQKEKPRFCSKCGDPIAIYAKDKVKSTYHINEDIDIEKDPSESIPKMQGLDIEIIPETPLGQTLGSIMESQPSEAPKQSIADEFGNLSQPKQSNKDFLKSFEKEAGSIKRKRNA